jgi:bifunctional oligoribonuclease and PAP phosphatase NrnA
MQIAPDEIDIQALKSLLSIPKNIVLTAHRNPDGDAIGSTLGLFHYLIQQGHTVKVMFPSEFPEFVAWLPCAHEVLIYDIKTEYCKEVLAAADIFFLLDFNALDRIDRMGEIIYHIHNKTKVMIDHHLDPEPCADYIFSDPSASSTSEMVYYFIEDMGHLRLMNYQIARCLYAGILTDTGSFRHNTSPRLMRTVGKLLEYGIDVTEIYELIFSNLPEKSLRLLGYCLNRRMEILEEFNTGIITLSRKDFEIFNIQRGDTEDIVNYLLKIKTVRLAIFITEQPNNITKISMRSKGDISVQEICRNYFKGGGHKNASGGSSNLHLRDTVAKVKEILPLYMDMLQKA